MEETSESRLRSVGPQPKSVYLQALCLFFGMNFMYHHQVFRASGSRAHFFAFMLVNAVSSYQIADATNLASLQRYATMVNNAQELRHREDMNYKLRSSLFL